MKTKIAFLVNFVLAFLIYAGELNAFYESILPDISIINNKHLSLHSHVIANNIPTQSLLTQNTKQNDKTPYSKVDNSKCKSEYRYTYGDEYIEKEEVLDVKTLLDDVCTSNIDPLTKNELIRKEIQKLNQELDELNEKINLLSKENKQLKNEIDKYNNEYNLKKERDNLIDELKNEARAYKINLDTTNIPDNYMNALNLLIIGNLDLAHNQFTEVVNNNEKNNKNKEYLGSTSKKYSNILIAYSYYWLGKINNINKNYNQAAEKFSLAYKHTNFGTLSLIALIGLIDSLTNLSKSTEACTAIKQFMQDYTKASSDKNFTLDQSYIRLVEKYKSINKCQ